MKNWNYIEGAKTGNIKNLDRNTGTIDWDVAIFNGQWYITMNGQKLKGPFPSMKEAERYLDGHKWELQGKYGNAKTGNKKVGNYGPDQAEAREFQQALRPIKSLIEEAGTAIYASSKEAISDLQKAKQEIDRAISWAKNL